MRFELVAGELEDAAALVDTWAVAIAVRVELRRTVVGVGGDILQVIWSMERVDVEAGRGNAVGRRRGRLDRSRATQHCIPNGGSTRF